VLPFASVIEASENVSFADPPTRPDDSALRMCTSAGEPVLATVTPLMTMGAVSEAGTDWPGLADAVEIVLRSLKWIDVPAGTTIVRALAVPTAVSVIRRMSKVRNRDVMSASWSRASAGGVAWGP
jgi:hypothetical protein